MCLSYTRYLSINPIVYCLIMSSDDDIPPMPPLETTVLFDSATSQSNSGVTSIQETSNQDHTMSQLVPSPALTGNRIRTRPSTSITNYTNPQIQHNMDMSVMDTDLQAESPSTIHNSCQDIPCPILTGTRLTSQTSTANATITNPQLHQIMDTSLIDTDQQSQLMKTHVDNDHTPYEITIPTTVPIQTNLNTSASTTQVRNDTTNESTTSTKTFAKIPLNGIVLPREKNKVFVDFLKYNLNVDQLSYYKDIIDTHRAKDYHDLDLESQRVTFMNGLMREHFGHKRVFKFNETTHDFCEISRRSLYLIIRFRLVNIKAYQKSISSSKRKQSTNNNKDKNNIIPNVTSKSFSLDTYDRSHPYSTFYKSSKTLFKVELWNYYSMFHSLYQPFSFVVYNYSHRLADTEVVHRCTRLKVNFPDNANILLITHGRLVHSGSASKYENNLSYNHSHDLRAFSGLVNDRLNRKENDNTTDFSNTRSSNRQSVDSLYHNHTQDGKVDRRTFSMCGPNCMTCVSMSGTKELNIEDVYKEHKLRIGFTTRGKAPKKIMGDMQKYGWVIYTGVNVHHKEYVYNLSDEFSNLVKKKPCVCGMVLVEQRDVYSNLMNLCLKTCPNV